MSVTPIERPPARRRRIALGRVAPGPADPRAEIPHEREFRLNPRVQSAETPCEPIQRSGAAERPRSPTLSTRDTHAVKTTDDAFMPTHERPQFFASSVMTTVLAQLQQGLQHSQPIMVVTGEAGVGKTFVLREACTRWGTRARTAWIDPRDAEADTLLATIMAAFGITRADSDTSNDNVEVFARTIAQWDSPAMLIMDRAEQLSTDALVELAHIVNRVRDARAVLRVTLVGRPTLATRLAEPPLQTVAARIGIRSRVDAMPIADVRPYLQHRINAIGGDASGLFSRKSSRELHLVTNGVTGHLDAVAVESLRVARASGVTQVTPEQVRRAAERTVWPQDGLDAAPRLHVSPSRQRTSDEATGTAPVAPPAPIAAAPPAPKPVPAPLPPPPSHPDSRVSEWVSRFTDGQGSVRFGARQQLPPMTTPEALSEALPKKSASSIMSRRVVTVLRASAPIVPGATPTPTNATPNPTNTPTPTHTAAVPPNVTPTTNVPTVTPVTPVADVTPATPTPAPTPSPSTSSTHAEPTPSVTATPGTPVAEASVVTPPVVTPTTNGVATTHDAAAPTNDFGRRGKRSKREKRRAEQQARTQAATPASPGPSVASPVIATTTPTEPAPTPVEPTPVATSPEPKPTRKPAPASPRHWSLERKPRHSRITQVIVPAVVMIGVALVAVVVSMNSGFDASRPPVAKTTPAVVTPVAPATVAAPAPDTLALSNDSTTTTTSTVAVAPVTPTHPATTATVASMTTTTPVTTVVPTETYSVAVGTYLFKDRAQTKARRIDNRTPWDARVETVKADGSRTYRILVGRFTSEAEATKAADRLLTRGLVSEALVEKVPNSPSRH